MDTQDPSLQLDQYILADPEIQVLLTQLHSTEEAAHDKEHQLRTLEHTYTNLQSTLIHYQMEHQSLVESNAQVANRVTLLEQKIEETRHDIDSRSEEHQGQEIKTLQEEIAALDKQIAELEAQAREVDNKRASAEARAATAHKQLATKAASGNFNLEISGSPNLDDGPVLVSPNSASSPSSLVTIGSLLFYQVEKINSSVKKILSFNSYGGWVLVGYTGPKTLMLQHSDPDGNVQGLQERLDPKQIQYSLIRIRIDATKTRDIFIVWTGPNVSLMERGRKSTHLADVKQILSPFHTYLTVKNKASFTLENVVRISSPTSGSHEID